VQDEVQVPDDTTTGFSEAVPDEQDPEGPAAATSAAATSTAAAQPIPEPQESMSCSQASLVKVLGGTIDQCFSTEQQSKLHNYVTCREKGCSCLSPYEVARMKSDKKRDKFLHEWLFRKSISYSVETQMWWSCFVEGEGVYCLLCRKHALKAEQNKSETFGKDPSTRFKIGALADHQNSMKHKKAVEGELMNRVSVFQKQLDEKAETENVVLEKAFTAVYWLAKENIANVKIFSLLNMVEGIGISELKHFQHRSGGSLRDILLMLGKKVADSIQGRVADQPFGLLVDDAADISNTEQMLSFIQYFDHDERQVAVSFLSVSNVFEESNSANAETLYGVLKV
jgi:hypothetical protein